MYYVIRYQNSYGTHVNTFSYGAYITMPPFNTKILYMGDKKECLEEEVNYVPQSSSLTENKMFNGKQK